MARLNKKRATDVWPLLSSYRCVSIDRWVSSYRSFFSTSLEFWILVISLRFPKIPYFDPSRIPMTTTPNWSGSRKADMSKWDLEKGPTRFSQTVEVVGSVFNSQMSSKDRCPQVWKDCYERDDSFWKGHKAASPTTSSSRMQRPSKVVTTIWIGRAERRNTNKIKLGYLL